MRLAVLTAPGRFELEELPVPWPGPGEVLVRVVVSGVCASELEAWSGGEEQTYPRCLGHEVSGTVAVVGDSVEGLSIGDPVGVWVTGSGFAEYVVAPARHCFPAGAAPLDTVLAEPLACAVNAVELADVRLGDDVVLVGAGFMGHLVHLLVGLRGARQVIVADPRHDALTVADRLGGSRTVNVASEDLASVVADLTDGRGADVTFECTGSAAALETLGRVTRMSGKVVLVGFHQGAGRTVPLGHWNWMAFDIRNGHVRDVATILRGMEVGLRLLRSGRIDLAPLVTHRFGLGDIASAFETALAKPPGFVKAVVVASPPGTK